MGSKQIQSIIESLASTLVMADPGDSEDLEQAAALFRKVAQWAESRGHKCTADAANASARAAEPRSSGSVPRTYS